MEVILTMFDIIVVFLLFVIILVSEHLRHKESEQWQNERKNLLDRIQAKDFVEYKQFETSEEPQQYDEPEEDPYKNYMEV